MNLKSRKARAPIAALGACALVAGGGWLTAASASPTPLALNSGATSPVVANLGYAATAAANASYATKVTDASGAVKLQVVSTPTGGQLAYNVIASNGTATTGFTAASSASNETQTVTVGGSPTGGTYTLTFSGQTTGTIAYNASAATVQTALEALSNIAVGDVTVSGSAGGPYTVKFHGAYAGTNVAAITRGTNSLTGGTSPDATIAETSAGAQDTSLASLGSLASSDYVYLTGDVPGTYTYRFFQDTNGNSQLDADDERSSSLVTMTVVDAGGIGTTTSTSDDVAPVITSSTPMTVGQAVSSSYGYTKSLSLSDARGSGVTTSLKAKLAALTFVDVDGTDTSAGALAGVADSTENAVTYTASTNAITYSVGTPTEAGTIALRADLKPSSSAADNTTYGTKTVTIDSNGVTSLTQAVTLVDGAVVAPSSSTATVKSGRAAVTYTATAVNTTPTPDVNVAGATVYFDLGGTDVGTLTTNGTLVDSATAVYSAVTNSSGVASLTVTTSDTTDGTTYTVAASTNGVSSTPATITTTYGDVAIDAVEVTNTTAQLIPEVTATSVTLRGKLLDQFGAAFQPASNATQQATIGIDPNDSTYDTSVVTGYGTVASGLFSYVYTPSTTPTAGQVDSFRFTYGAETIDGAISWASSTAASTITITSPTDLATGVDLEDSQHTPSGVALTGTVYDATSTGLAYKAVTLTGSAGVYFSTSATADATHPLATTLTAATNASGAIQSAYVYYTKPGTATVMATSGAATKTHTVTTDDSVDPYKVVAINAKGKPGTTIAVTGRITDLFGHKVVGETAHLTLSDNTVGVLADSAPETDSNGVWSTTITPAANQNGEVTITAKLDNGDGTTLLTANPTPHAGWATAGLEYGDGEYLDTATITVGASSVTLHSSPRLTFGTSAYNRGALLTGTGADAGATVEIWSKLPGGTYALVATTLADSTGDFSTTVKITKSTYFLAKAGGVSSLSSATRVYSSVMLTAASTSTGKVTLTADGGPNRTGVLTFYWVKKNGDVVKLGSKTSDAAGKGSITASAPSGKRTFRVLFRAAGTTTGSDTASTTVK